MNNPYKDHFKKAKNINPSQKKQVRLNKTSNDEVSKKNLQNIDDLRTELRSRNLKRKQAEVSRRKQPLHLLVAMSLGAILCTLGLLYTDKIDEFISKVEVGGFSQASAEEAKTSQENSPVQEKNSTDIKPSETPKNISWTPEQINNFNKLRERKLELDKREKDLAKLEEELHQQKGEIEKRIQELSKMRQNIAKVLESKVEVDEEKITKLVDFYSNMKPNSAAQVIQDMDEDLAVEILGKMKKKSAANIMNLLKPEKAQKLTEKFAGYMR